jgi:hypothetical protein
VARETLELSVTRQAERQHVLERRKAAARTPGEREKLAVLRRNEACLKSLRGFDEAAEAEDERGRRRLWVEYRRGGTASEGRGRHHVIGGYADGGAGEDGRPKWRSVSRHGCSVPGSSQTRLTVSGGLDFTMGNYLDKNSRSLRQRERRPCSYAHTAAPVLGPRAVTLGGGGEFRPVGRRVSFTASCAAPTGRVPGLGGAFIIATVHRALVLVLGTNIAVLLDCSKSSRQCSLPSFLTAMSKWRCKSKLHTRPQGVW